MADLDHIYTSDITYEETFAYAADTEFDAQRMGQNTNYLLDQFGPIISDLNTINATATKIATFSTSVTVGTGNFLIYTNPAGSTKMALIFIAPSQTNLPVSQSGFVQTYGPPIPVIINREASGIQNTIYNSGSSTIYLSIGNSPTWDQIILHCNGGGTFSIRGVLFNG